MRRRPAAAEKQSDGSYVLKLSDLDDFVHGLKSALAKCRLEIKELRAAEGISDGVAALSAFGVIPEVRRSGTQDVRAGMLPRRNGTP